MQKDNLIKFVCFLGVILIGLSCQQNKDSKASEGPESTIVSVEDEGRPSIGSENAPIRLIVFTDFECGYCKDLSDNIESIKKDYVASGKVRLVIRNFPLEMHDHALGAALCASCADEQGAFWEMYGVLYQNQADLSGNNFIKWAAEMDLDTVAFISCMKSEKTLEKINEDISQARKLGISGTPAFIINDEMYMGAPDEELLRQMLDEAIEKTK